LTKINIGEKVILNKTNTDLYGVILKKETDTKVIVEWYYKEFSWREINLIKDLKEYGESRT